ncbi:hypothetical protein GJR96_14110 [Haloferax sp. MBLA0076]|uniref:Uncharacterized protein n=1 Tax=Haloferax litoreum TaxID=2666140 RepID=A0A6A8GI78_9EURY|nr:MULTISPECIES: hypothetical protein [Haloferax]KAB1194513.1 hypothetical protein Hfx1148_14045 [Haloferax sp. CBA1148]MRX23084.1 hypothetical protein [Haloferax litoreum]
MTSWKHFVAFFVFGSLVLVGVALFVVHVDYDYHYTYEREVDEFPRDTLTMEYAALQPDERRVVDEAFETGGVVMQDGSTIPDEGIKKDGHKYLFSAYKSFDWTDPGTFGPTFVGLVGGFGVLATIRADMKNSLIR